MKRENHRMMVLSFYEYNKIDWKAYFLLNYRNRRALICVFYIFFVPLQAEIYEKTYTHIFCSLPS